MSHHPKPDWLRELASIAAELGYRPDSSEFTEHGSVTYQAFYRHYDSWEDVLAAARELTDEPALAVENPHPKGTLPIPEEELLAELRAAYAALGRPPRKRDLDEWSDYCAQTFFNRFGTLDAAYETAGLPRN